MMGKPGMVKEDLYTDMIPYQTNNSIVVHQGACRSVDKSALCRRFRHVGYKKTVE